MHIQNLTLLTANPADTLRFYTETLGLSALPGTNGAVTLLAGSTQLTFEHTGAYSRPFYHFAFNIPCNKITEAVQWCHQKGLQLLPYMLRETIDFPNWNAKSLYFTDNNGNILEFIARNDLNNATGTAFNAGHILCVSEIGIVTDAVLPLCQNLNQTYGLPYYEKQKPEATFSVMGNAEGLLIVVPEKRNWFPTNIPSARFPVSMAIRQQNQTCQLQFQ